MKKFFSLLMVMVALCGFTIGCGGDDAGGDAGSTPAAGSGDADAGGGDADADAGADADTEAPAE